VGDYYRAFLLWFVAIWRHHRDTSENTPLCIARTTDAIVQSGCGRAFHINRPVCTGLFPRPVGVVGNMGRFTALAVEFSKSPHLHSSVLENLDLMQTSLLKPLHPSFHFSSVNYGYYCLFSLFFYSFPRTRRGAILGAQKRQTRQRARCARSLTSPVAPNPRNPEKYPCFPRAH
jgi:hypothetical protein